MNILAVILARGGSKGIPKKNIVEVCGRPLISYSICAALKSELITDLIVSTDSEEIADILPMWYEIEDPTVAYIEDPESQNVEEFVDYYEA